MSAAIALINDPVAGGKLISTPAATVKINKQPVCLAPANVSPHGDSPHNSAVVSGGKITTVKIEKKQPVGDGDTASCGDTVKATQKTVLAK